MSVVGFVLAAAERKVRGSDNWEDEVREGDGEGGLVGGRGRMEASSSASGACDGAHSDSWTAELP